MRKKSSCFAIFWGIITTLVMIFSLMMVICLLLDKKKRKEDKELEDYLDAAIV